MMGYRYGMMAGGWFIWIIFVALAGVIIYTVFRASNRRGMEGGSAYGASNGRAAEILKERFAKGEINEEEYMRMKEAIKK